MNSLNCNKHLSDLQTAGFVSGSSKDVIHRNRDSVGSHCAGRKLSDGKDSGCKDYLLRWKILLISGAIFKIIQVILENEID